MYGKFSKFLSRQIQNKTDVLSIAIWLNEEKYIEPFIAKIHRYYKFK